MKASIGTFLTVTLAAAGFAGDAWALDNDPALDRLCTFQTQQSSEPCGGAIPPKGAAVVADQEAFRELSREYGMIFAPVVLAPAETMGVNGFQLNLQIGVHAINSDEDYWARGVQDQDPDAVMTTMRFDVRKGLPYSFELGMNGTYLLESELWSFGGGLKWAINEAVDAFPVDIAVRGTLNRVVGSPTLELTTAGFDLIVGKSFGAGGVANIAPYIAYSPAWVIARSGVVDATPGDDSDPEASIVFSAETQVLHRFVIGSRFILGAFNFTPEVAVAQGLVDGHFNVGVDF